MILNLKLNFLIFVNESPCSEIVISMQITKKLMDKFCISLYLREQYKYTLTDLFLVFSELIRPCLVPVRLFPSPSRYLMTSLLVR